MKKEYVTPEQHTVVLHCQQLLLTESTFEFTDGFSLEGDEDDKFVDPGTSIGVGGAL